MARDLVGPVVAFNSQGQPLIPVVPDPVTAELIRDIQRAFAGVGREGGISWSQTSLRDPSEVEESARVYEDTDQEWSDLVTDETWRPVPARGGLRFLDAIGSRYYLPAAMIRALHFPWQVDFAPVLIARRREEVWDRNPWLLLSDPQRRVVARFVRSQMSLQLWGEPEDAPGWAVAYYRYWHRIDPRHFEDRDELARSAGVTDLSDVPRQRATLLADIKTTFEGVTREGGVSWSEADVLDLDGTDEQRAAERAKDLDRTWHDLVADPNWHSDRSWHWSFLDPIGFRYYVAKSMVRTLSDPIYPDEVSDFDATDPSEDRARTGNWSHFTDEQPAAFLAYREFQWPSDVTPD